MADHPFSGTLSVTDKIGIGIEEPIAQLHIASSTPAPSQTFLESGGALLKLSVDASGAAIGTDNAFPFSIKTDDTPRISIDKIGNVTISGALSVQKSLTVSGNVGIGTANPEAKLHVVGDLLGAAKDELGNALRICCGKTPEGRTNWQVYRDDGVFVEVDTSLCGFRATPLYFVNMHGNGYNWETTGGSSAYNRTAKSFRVYVKFSDYRKFTPEFANSQGWHIQWVALGN